MRFTVLVLAVSVLLAGCIGGGDEAQQEQSATTTVPANNVKMAKEKYVVIETDKGTIKAKLYTEKAPISTKNFMGLAERGFYEGLVFHRVEPGFVIQTGDPEGTGRGGSGQSIPLEIHKDLKHELGAFGMARTNDPNSATSQFYIVTGDASFLDGNYAVFGMTVEGIEVAKQIKVGDKMKKVTIVEE